MERETGIEPEGCQFRSVQLGGSKWLLFQNSWYSAVFRNTVTNRRRHSAVTAQPWAVANSETGDEHEQSMLKQARRSLRRFGLRLPPRRLTRPPQYILHRLWMLGDDCQQHAGGRVGARTALLPVSERGWRETELCSELRLA